MYTTHFNPDFFLGKAFRVLLLICLFFILGESAFRVRAQYRFGQTRGTMIIDDPVEGRSLRPNAVSEGAVRTVRINEHGTRGKSFSFDRPDELVRIACLGSSSVFGGITNSDDETFPAYLEKILNQRIGELGAVEVLNAGIAGMSTSSVQQHIERRISKFHPQIAVFYVVPNDVGVLRQGSPETNVRSLHFLSRWRRENSVMYDTLRNRFSRYSPGTAANQFIRFPADGEEKLEKMYENLFQSCRQLQIVPVAVSHSVPFRRDQSAKQQHQMLFGDFFGFGLAGAFEAVETMNQTWRRVAEQNGVLFIDGENSMPGTAEYFADAVHHQPSGNKKLAEEIAKKLLEHDVLTPFLQNNEQKTE